MVQSEFFHLIWEINDCVKSAFLLKRGDEGMDEVCWCERRGCRGQSKMETGHSKVEEEDDVSSRELSISSHCSLFEG